MVPSPNGRMGVMDEKRNKNKNEMGNEWRFRERRLEKSKAGKLCRLSFPVRTLTKPRGAASLTPGGCAEDGGDSRAGEKNFNSLKRSYGVQRLMMIKFQNSTDILRLLAAYWIQGWQSVQQIRWNWPYQSHRLATFQSLLPYAIRDELQ